MSYAASGTNNMAFSNNSRSFTNVGSAATADSKGAGPSLNPTYGTANKAWGSSNIWGSGSLTNGFNSRDATRDNSRSRDIARQSSTSEAEMVEGKTGSGSLVDSSISDDWNYRTAWGAKRSLPTGRSISQARQHETSTFQQRSTSNAGVPAFLNTVQNQQSFVSRPPTINLNSTSSAQGRTSFATTFSAGFGGRGSEQPPNVYTKFDRPSDLTSWRLPDSAKEGSWADYSPTDERKPTFGSQHGSRNASTPVSRDGSIPSSQQGNDQPFFTKPDYSRTSQRATQNNSRAPSVSSQANGAYLPFMNPNVDQMAFQLNRLNMSQDDRPSTSYRNQANSNTMINHSSSSSSALPFSRSGLGNTDSSQDISDDLQEIDRISMNYLGLDGYVSSQQTPGFPEYMHAGFGGRTSQTPTAGDFRQAQSFANGTAAPRHFDVPTGPRSTSHWTALADANLNTSRDAPNPLEHAPFLDFRMQQMLASQLRNAYAPTYNPYALPNGLPLGATTSYVPFLPMNLPPVESPRDGHDATANLGDSMQSALMYEFKSNSKSKRYELKDIYDHIAEFSGDQHGSRFIQTKLESANSDEKERVFRELQPNAIQLMTDVFGNYVIQKFFEHGDQTHKKILANKMKGQVLNLSLQMYGCRVVQKALDHVLVDQQYQLISELESHVLRCVKDQNGNHVIQKAIEKCPPKAISFIINAFTGQVQHLSVHPYGCRVIQRCLERCDPPSKAKIMGELLSGIQSMISDQYGNYVVQHIVGHDDGEGRRRVLDIVGRSLEAYSKHKFASNVVEKCLEMADDNWKRQVVYTIANGNPHQGEGEGVFVGMIKDSYGNYVIQKLLDTLSNEDYLHFLDLLQPAMTQAKRTGCGKQVLSIEKKMHRFPSLRSGLTNAGAFNPHAYQLPIPPPPFACNLGSAANTPPPLTADTQSLQSLQSSAIQSINGDAVEGAAIGSRKGSEPSNEGGYFR